MSLLAALLEVETRIWQGLVSGDRQAEDTLLSGDFLGVYPSGLSGRDGHAAQLLSGPSMVAFQLSEVQARSLSDSLALLVYRADFHRAGQALPEAMWVSSLWQRQGDGWINLFSQDTPIP